MIDRMLASDPSYNGRFLTGVLTTGIYCLPSCRARKPKPDNVRFFDNPTEAQEAGLRACKRCRPDDFYRHRDPDREAVESLVERVRREPSAFARVEDLESASGMGASKLHEVFRRHFHSTPAQILTRSRVEAAQKLLLESDHSIATVAFEVGFEGLSTFNKNFRHLAALSPKEYRRLPGTPSFRIELPPDYPLELMLEYLGRDNDSSTIQVEGRRFAAGLRLGGAPAVLKVELAPGVARASVEGRGPLPADAAARAHGQLLRILGLTRDPGVFEKRVAATPQLAPLIEGRRGLRIPQTLDAFDGLTWVILGQQITLSFAFTLRRRLVERTAAPAGGGLFTPPSAEAVANLDVEELVKEQFSRRKAEYLIGSAQRVASGELPLDRLAATSASRAEAELLAVRGLGPWSVHYLLMRAFGFEDCVPVGDAGLVKGLAKFFGLPGRPDPNETLELMRPFAPYRSWATFHFWQSLKDE
ncbi:MAG TPA: Ada metal-binding domain-containing protein [Thermoanaerobaculia bacterium]|nr:Ada metal-binding domain-containing protein [Thermoanaerobaculia bacterium]